MICRRKHEAEIWTLAYAPIFWCPLWIKQFTTKVWPCLKYFRFLCCWLEFCLLFMTFAYFSLTDITVLTLLANERLLLFILYVVKWQNLRTFLIIQIVKSVVFSDYMNFKSLVLSNWEDIDEDDSNNRPILVTVFVFITKTCVINN